MKLITLLKLVIENDSPRALLDSNVVLSNMNTCDSAADAITSDDVFDPDSVEVVTDNDGTPVIVLNYEGPSADTD